MARVQHPGVVTLHELVEDAEVPLLVLALPAGEPLAHRLAAGPMAVEAVRRLGLVPLGYGDGLARELWHGGSVLVRGQRAPIVGVVADRAVPAKSVLTDAIGMPAPSAGLPDCTCRSGVAAVAATNSGSAARLVAS